ncbi:hypothetical protein Tco_0802203 [Tanacetum coccineum]|uniref:Reverse transcriptase domain-containing protein n=1 Tax=Tanacetum coccineum TaxID=301880 RepID=A0ABQ4ZY51_9ASTR
MINEGVTAALAARDATRTGDNRYAILHNGCQRDLCSCSRNAPTRNFLKCQPLNFKGTEGVVGLTQWFKKMESVYSINNCTVACQVNLLHVPCNPEARGTTRISNQTRDKTLEELMAARKWANRRLIRRALNPVSKWSPPNVNTRANQRACFECGKDEKQKGAKTAQKPQQEAWKKTKNKRRSEKSPKIKPDHPTPERKGQSLNKVKRTKLTSIKDSRALFGSSKIKTKVCQEEKLY